MKIIPTKRTYLEMFAPPAAGPPPPLFGTEIERLHAPSIDTYRSLYNGVGKAYRWTDRNRMPDDELFRIIQDPAVEIYVLYLDGATAGYVELDRRSAGEIEIAYFGLFPAFIGRGLGKYFLSWALDRAWSFGPRRVWIHTCDLDHPAALANYLRAGFAVFNEKLIEQIVPDE
jgi:GNAT superfamily N-acetyltransferase